jgi:hypothetical protein
MSVRYPRAAVTTVLTVAAVAIPVAALASPVGISQARLDAGLAARSLARPQAQLQISACQVAAGSFSAKTGSQKADSAS